MKKSIKNKGYVLIVLFMAICSLQITTHAQEVSDVASGTSGEDIAENRNVLIDKMIDNSEDGSATVNIGDNLTYRYHFSCSENNFNAGYRIKEDGWTKTFNLTYNYETDLVNINFQQLKNSNFYAATAEFTASKFTDIYMITFKDATASSYGGMCVTYAEKFAKIAFPDINNRMITLFDSSLCKIGFISYAHEHSGGSATCVELAKCQICGKEYGGLKDHKVEIVNEKQETFYEEGYTGDQVCTVCGKIIESGTVIPVKERIEATGKFALVKKFLKEKGQTDDDGNKYFYTSAMVSDKIGAIATITYIEDEAKFQFAYGDINNNRIVSTIAMFIDENGSQTVNVDYSHDIFSLKASATFDVEHYVSGGKEYFEKTSSNILDNSEIQDLCNAELKAAFTGWDMLLLKYFGFDVNMADMGFTSYEEAGTHTWDSGQVTTKATCEKTGIKEYRCSVCNETKTENIPVMGHRWNSGDVTKVATATIDGIKTYTCSICKETKTEVIPATGVPNNGSSIKDENGIVYKVTKARTSGGTVEFAKINSSSDMIDVPEIVTIDGITYKVTSIAVNAFKGNKKITKVTIGKNILKIGKNAFSGCTKLKSITIKTTKLTTKNVGKNAFKNINKKAIVKVPAKKLSAYKKLLKKKGITEKKQKIKK